MATKKISELPLITALSGSQIGGTVIPVVVGGTTDQISAENFSKFVNAYNATTGSNTFIGNQTITGNVVTTGNGTFGGNVEVAGMITAQQYNVTYVSSSVQYQSGSTKFGDTADDTHTFTGTLSLNGSAIGLGQLNSFTASTNAHILGISKQTGSQDIVNFNISKVTASIDAHIFGISKQTGSQDLVNFRNSTATSSLNFATSSIQAFTSSQDGRNFIISQITASLNSHVLGISIVTSSIDAHILGTSIQTASQDLVNFRNSTVTSSLNFATSSIQSYTASLKGAILPDGTDLSVIGNLKVTGSAIADALQIDINAGITAGVGQFTWNAQDGTMNLGMVGGNATLQLGQETYYPLVTNRTGAIITEGTVVMVNPTTPVFGNKPSVIPAIATGQYPAHMIMGIATEDIAINGSGLITWFGYVRNLSKSALQPVGETWVEGNILYANPNIAGGLTNIQPYAPQHKSTIAVITTINGNNVTLLVRPELGQEVSELNDVNISNVQHGDLLMRSGSNSAWVNSKQLSGSYAISGGLKINGEVLGNAGLNSFTASILSTNSGISSVTGSLNAFTASQIGKDGTLAIVTSSFRNEIGGIEAYTASLKNAIIVNGTNVQIIGELDVARLNVQYVSSSVAYSSGSNVFGDQTSDKHEFTGSVTIADTLFIKGQAIGTGELNSFTGSQIGKDFTLSKVTASIDAHILGISTYTASTTIVLNSIDAHILGISTATASIKAEIAGLEALTASMKSQAIVSSSTQIQNYDVFALNSNLYNSTGSLQSEINGIMALTASMKAAAIVSSSQQVQNYFTFAKTGSANTFYGIQTFNSNIEVSTTDLNSIFVTNPTTNGTTTGAGIGFKAYNGTSVAQSAGIILTSNSWSYGTYSANQLSVGSDGNGGIALRSANSASISFFTGGTTAGLSTEKIRINSSGSLLLNTTTNTGDNLYIAGKDAPYWMTTMVGTSTAGISYGLNILAGTNSSDTSLLVRDTVAGNTYFKIRGDGMIAYPQINNFTTGNSPNTWINPASSYGIYINTSSARYKKDITNYDRGIDIVKQLRPVYYKGISEVDGDKQFAGLIAEEIHDLGLTEFVNYLEDGRPNSLSYPNMITLAFKAMQEQQAIIDGLLARIEVLENK